MLQIIHVRTDYTTNVKVVSCIIHLVDNKVSLIQCLIQYRINIIKLKEILKTIINIVHVIVNIKMNLLECNTMSEEENLV